MARTVPTMTDPLQLQSIQALQALADDLKAMLAEAETFVAAAVQDVHELRLETAQLQEATSALEALRSRTQEALAALRSGAGQDAA